MTLTEMTADLPEQVIETAAAEALDDRLTEPTDIAEAVLFLSAGTSRHITGVVLPVDGGQLL
jgi:NAD(P)-dependent dehydrogenase (short-subunit alcohol dehydrogenase family)